MTLPPPQFQPCSVLCLGGRVSALSVNLREGNVQALPSKSTRLPCFPRMAVLACGPPWVRACCWPELSGTLKYWQDPHPCCCTSEAPDPIRCPLCPATWSSQICSHGSSRLLQVCIHLCCILLVRHQSCSRGRDHTGHRSLRVTLRRLCYSTQPCSGETKKRFSEV